MKKFIIEYNKNIPSIFEVNCYLSNDKDYALKDDEFKAVIRAPKKYAGQIYMSWALHDDVNSAYRQIIKDGQFDTANISVNFIESLEGL